MAWQDRLTDKMVRPFFYVIIEGIGTVFCSGPGPGWSAPKCARNTASIPDYAVLNDCLQVGAGIRPIGWRVNEKDGVVDPGSMALTLTDTPQHTLRRLFATRLSTAHTTRAASTLTWTADAGGDARYKLDVDSTTGFAAAGPLFLGRETLYYDTLAATRFGDDPEDAADLWRGCYAWRWHATDDWDRWHLDYRHWYDAGNTFVAEAVSDNPRTWVGRRVILCMNWMREQPGGDPVPFDTDWRGAHEVEVYAGVLAADPQPKGEGEWTLQLRPLTSLLATMLGANAADGVVGMPSGDPWVFIPPMAYGCIMITDARIQAQLPPFNWTQYLGTSGAGGHSWIHLRDPSGAIVTNELITVHTMIRYVANGIHWELTNNGGGDFINWPVARVRRAWIDEAGYMRLEIGWAHPGVNWRCFLRFTLGEMLSAINIDFRTNPDEWGGATGWTSVSTPVEVVPPMAFLVDFTEFSIPVALSDTARAFAREFDDAGGYAILGTGEVVKYKGMTTASTPPGYQMMQIAPDGRGALGTEAQYHEYQYLSGLLAKGNVKIIDAAGVDNDNIWDILLMAMVSTGGGARETDYDSDAFGRHWGARIDPSMLDHDSFARMIVESGDAGRRTMALVKPRSLKDWVEAECKFAQAVITQRTCPDGRCRIGVYPLEDPAQSEALANTLSSLRAELTGEAPAIVNSVSIATGWHAGKGDHEGPDVHIRHVESIYNGQRERNVKLETPGLTWPWQSAAGGALQVAKRIMARWLEPGKVLALYCGAEAVLYQHGQTISITVPDIPTDEGGAGYSARAATVLGVEWSPYNPGEDWQAKVVVRVRPGQRYSTYCPCGRVDAYDAGRPAISLEPNDFSSTSDPNPWAEHPTTDAVWFQAGYRIWIWDEGDWANGEASTITARAGNHLELSGVLALVPGANTLITYDSYDSGLHANQKLWVYIGDNGAPPTLGAANDAANEYA